MNTDKRPPPLTTAQDAVREALALAAASKRSRFVVQYLSRFYILDRMPTDWRPHYLVTPTGTVRRRSIPGWEGHTP